MTFKVFSGKTVGLAIGINNYNKYKIVKDLKFATNDAVKFLELLVKDFNAEPELFHLFSDNTEESKDTHFPTFKIKSPKKANILHF